MTSGRIEFVVEADEPALFFDSRLAAETSLESIDVEDGIYPIAFDRTGVIYDVVPNGRQASLMRRAGAQADPDGLASVLKRFLAATNNPFSEEEPLERLLAKCEAYLGPPRKWPGRRGSGAKFRGHDT